MVRVSVGGQHSVDFDVLRADDSVRIVCQEGVEDDGIAPVAGGEAGMAEAFDDHGLSRSHGVDLVGENSMAEAGDLPNADQESPDGGGTSAH